MNVIKSGMSFTIHGDGISTYDSLPCGTFDVRFEMLRGFWLEKREDIDLGGSKIYGSHEEKAEKVMRGFAASDRNFGVILSGAKGIGKSLFAKLVSSKAIAAGIPVIIVSNNYSGLPGFIESITQPVMVLFDEFEKVFAKKEDQEMFLSTFDGTSNGNKLFVVTCNEVSNLSDFMINRPGRFHYHIRFEHPADEEVVEYMRDALLPEHHDAIDDVVAFSSRVQLNYDCLRAIAFEMNMGYSLSDAVKDLNIVHTRTERYNITAIFKNGAQAKVNGMRLDLFNPGRISVYPTTVNGGIGCAELDTSSIEYSYAFKAYEVTGDKVGFIYWTPDDGDSDPDKNEVEAAELQKAGLERIIFSLDRGCSDIHYLI